MRSLLLATTLALPALSLAQGQLTPPPGAFSGGAPTATMKTLDQLEPRTPLAAGASGVTQNSNGGFTITNRGSYYLTSDLSVTSGNAIVITASNVTLDLNGFTLSSSDANATSDAIVLPSPATRIAIRNGRIAGGCAITSEGTFAPGPGFANGLSAASTSGCLLEDLTVTGMRLSGLGLDATFTANSIRRCTVAFCGGGGLGADLVEDSLAIGVFGSGIVATQVVNSRAESLGYGSGIQAATVSNSTGIGRSYIGINSDLVLNSVGESTDSHGIAASIVTGCRGKSSALYGIMAISAINCLGETSTLAGILACNATNCQGTSDTGDGLVAYTVANCNGTSNSGIGLNVIDDYYLPSPAGVAENSGGWSDTGDGLVAALAMNCVGHTNSGTRFGILVEGTANSCRGTNTDPTGGVAIKAAIAVACTAKMGGIEVTTANGKQLGTTP